jgi:hypothetical protein
MATQGLEKATVISYEKAMVISYENQMVVSVFKNEVPNWVYMKEID